MSRFFGNSDETEFVYDEVDLTSPEEGEVETETVVNEPVEVPKEVVQPEQTEVTPKKENRKGKSVGGADYVYYGDFR